MPGCERIDSLRYRDYGFAVVNTGWLPCLQKSAKPVRMARRARLRQLLLNGH